ncbi:MAG: protein-disulfide reductase DsbD [Rhodocyclaceae bacterium]|nr:protein-disulfide reductase DsbD [Rhodocyclaceae bacterium]
MIRCVVLFLLTLFGAAHAEEPLPPDQAFRFSARVVDGKTIEARWQITDGYYMYRDKFKFTLEGGKLGAVTLPRGLIKADETFGEVETLRKEVKVLLPVSTDPPGSAAKLTLKTVSQGCWDGGICYPPLRQQAVLDLPGTSSLAKPANVSGAEASNAVLPAPTGAAATSMPPAAPQNETSRVADLFKASSLSLILLSFFGFGLLLSLTPCVFPMVPILSGIIVNHGHAVTHLRAFVLSCAYVLGMAITYALVGVAAGLSGTLLSSALQNAWVLGSFALIFVLLSLSMFGFYELQLPSALQSRLSGTANRQGGSLSAIAVMGALSALIVGPCVAAPLAGALLYIAKTGDAVLGGAALFVMALGMGAPLLLVGAFSRSLLPKSGPWMEGVKQFFGVVMLATALWMVSPVLPPWLVMLGWAALLIVPAIYLHALDNLPANAHRWQRFGKGIGVMLLMFGTAILLGLLGGARDPLQPLQFLRGSANAATPHAPAFARVTSTADLDRELAMAKRPVMLDFYADWCVSCKEMERFTFTDPAIAAAMSKMRLVQADVTANSEADAALLKRFDLFGPPGIIFFDANGREIPELRVVGFVSADQFLPTLERALR